jgi:structural maintenance of chromosome 1
VAKLVERLGKAAKEVEEQLSKMTAPSTKVDERMDHVKGKESENQTRLDEGRREAIRARKNFEKVKADRLKRFQDFFEPVANRIDEIYKVILEFGRGSSPA